MTLDQALEKALKLLRLAKSPNAHEAALAAAKAQEVIDRYKLDINDIDFDAQETKRDNEPVKDFGYEDPLDETSYLQAWITKLSFVVSNHNGCRIIYRKVDTMGDGKNRGAVIKVVGRPSDVQTTRYLYALLRSEVLRLRDEACVGNGRTFKRQFALGVVDTIARKLNEQRSATEQAIRAENASNPLALVRVNKAIAKQSQRLMEVAKFVEESNPQLRSSSYARTQTITGASARQMGRKEGEKVRITKASGALGQGRKELR